MSCSGTVELIQQQEDPSKKEEITIRTVVLRLPMHCDGCAKDIKRSIYKMKGVLRVEPKMEKGTVTVTGAFEDSQLLKYSRKRVNKYADIVTPDKQPAEDSKAEEDKAEAEDEASCEEEEAVVFYHPWNPTHHSTCPCEMLFNDENVYSCCVM